MKDIEFEFKINSSYETPKVVIYTNEITEEVNELINVIKDLSNEKIIGFKDEQAYILEKEKIESIYTEDKKIMARVGNEIYQVKKRIFELEKILSEKNFVRISNSEIINFKFVESMDFKLTGTIILKFKNGSVTYTSRRYIKKIKEYLGL